MPNPAKLYMNLLEFQLIVFNFKIYWNNEKLNWFETSFYILWYYTHQAGSSSLKLWILQENGLLGIGYGHCGSPRPGLAKSDKSNFGQNSILALLKGPNLT